MIGLFYDTETTGLPLFNEPSEDPRQPHIVQLAASLIDLESRATLASMDVIVRPADWEIPEEVAAIHGITTEHARALGVREAIALELFLELWSRSSLRVAHNEQFDARIIRIALLRYGPCPVPDTWQGGRCRSLPSPSRRPRRRSSGASTSTRVSSRSSPRASAAPAPAKTSKKTKAKK